MKFVFKKTVNRDLNVLGVLRYEQNREEILLALCTQGLEGGEVACDQALRGALAAGREKEGDLATTSLEFEYPHRKSRCKMLIGGYDISNDIITLGTLFSMFVYIRARSCFALIGGNLTAQLTGSHRGIGSGI